MTLISRAALSLWHAGEQPPRSAIGNGSTHDLQGEGKDHGRSGDVSGHCRLGRRSRHRIHVSAISKTVDEVTGRPTNDLRSSRGPPRHIGRPQPRLKTAAFVEAMHARVPATALQEDVMAIGRPGCCERSAHDSTPMALPPKIRMRDDVIEKSVLSTGTQKVRRCHERARRDDPGVSIGHEHEKTFAREHFGPDSFRPRPWLRARAHFRRAKQRKQGVQVIRFGYSRFGHAGRAGVSPLGKPHIADSSLLPQ